MEHEGLKKEPAIALAVRECETTGGRVWIQDSETGKPRLLYDRIDGKLVRVVS